MTTRPPSRQFRRMYRQHGKIRTPLSLPACYRDIHEEGPHLLDSDSPFIARLQGMIRFAVKVLSTLMVLVIFWGVLDVAWVLFERLSRPPVMLLEIHDILAIFGAFMAVLIAIEIFLNISMYLEQRAVHVKLVLDTAIMAAARKVIVLDYKQTDAWEVLALAAVLAALGVCYWLALARERRKSGDGY